MSHTLYVEASICRRTGAAGWGAVLKSDGAEVTFRGVLGGGRSLTDTKMQLAAIHQAVLGAVGRRGRIPALEISCRSTAALAVLRWVFWDAPFSGDLEVNVPRSLRRDVKEFQPLYDLHDAVEDARLRISLRHVAASDITEIARSIARQEMEAERANHEGTTR